MKLANRIGAAVLATAMVGTLLTGCGGGSTSTSCLLDGSFWRWGQHLHHVYAFYLRGLDQGTEVV